MCFRIISVDSLNPRKQNAMKLSAGAAFRLRIESCAQHLSQNLATPDGLR
jgi:hypothetical protein